jgi:hypothetical protein
LNLSGRNLNRLERKYTSKNWHYLEGNFMFNELPKRCVSKDSFLSFAGQNGLLHISWLLNDGQIVFFEKDEGEDMNSALSMCSVQEYCKAMLTNNILKTDFITKDHIIKLLDVVEFA